jgi:hypothetical protein
MKRFLHFAGLAAAMFLVQTLAEAGCAAGPGISQSSTGAAPGETVIVKGTQFQKVRILFIQGKHTTEVGKVDADRNFVITARQRTGEPGRSTSRLRRVENEIHVLCRQRDHGDILSPMRDAAASNALRFSLIFPFATCSAFAVSR